ncbi:hypothetical protein CEK26_000635 [Fusarium fujikuroi]|nr:uncharacterized protein LW93_10467 [Fusarium fujikuroi]KLP10860.1 uncharacterized protein Y057_8830 [Fusarium fujikuroi]KLP20081.1 uncharacterized protein LW94_14256 [Fusarium fujikuroi]QGI58511.1 hypothetical protein CEK27_000636 [Fusarium fujikuroi]QGI75729.1 hypothetical protein CEK25_000635 [Fusarium fujikuroi]
MPSSTSCACLLLLGWLRLPSNTSQSMSARNIRSLIVLVGISSPLFIPQVLGFWCRLISQEEDEGQGSERLPFASLESYHIPSGFYSGRVRLREVEAEAETSTQDFVYQPTPPVCIEAFINGNSQPVKLTLGVL